MLCSPVVNNTFQQLKKSIENAKKLGIFQTKKLRNGRSENCTNHNKNTIFCVIVCMISYLARSMVSSIGMPLAAATARTSRAGWSIAALGTRPTSRSRRRRDTFAKRLVVMERSQPFNPCLSVTLFRTNKTCFNNISHFFRNHG